MNKLGLLLALIGLPFLPNCSCVYFARPPHSEPLEASIVISSEEPFIHTETGISFPLHAGEFKRVRVEQFDEEAYDVAVGYQERTPQGDIDVTLYLAPGPTLMSGMGNRPQDQQLAFLEEALEGGKQGLLLVNPESTVDSEGPSSLIAGHQGLCTFFSVPRTSAFGDTTVGVETHVFIVDTLWFLKVRASYAPACRELARVRMKELIEEINLPEGN